MRGDDLRHTGAVIRQTHQRVNGFNALFDELRQAPVKNLLSERKAPGSVKSRDKQGEK